MAGTAVLTERVFGVVKKITFAWTSDAAGDVSQQTAKSYNGMVERAVFIPDAVDVPTAAYDVTLLDEDGLDVLFGQGADRSAVAAEQVPETFLGALLGPVAYSKLTLVVANAGNAKKGTVHVYVR